MKALQKRIFSEDESRQYLERPLCQFKLNQAFIVSKVSGTDDFFLGMFCFLAIDNPIWNISYKTEQCN